LSAPSRIEGFKFGIALTKYSKLFSEKTACSTDLRIPSQSESTESTKEAMKPIRLLFLFLSFCPLAVHAQTAEVGGAVQDPCGAVIPKASVEFRNQDTGVRRQSTTNGDGAYHIEGIDPGKYDATVQAKGFKTLTRENVVFQVGDKAQIDFKMQVGDTGQTVTVDGSGLQINTTDASVSTVVDRKFVENLPLNGRSFEGLILLTPGVETVNPNYSSQSGYSGEFSVNGQRTESNVYTVDGVNANAGGFPYGYATNGTSGSLPSATALGTTQSLVSVDALQEFRVEGSSYSAEFGLSPGGQFSFATRSGTNELHGSAFDYVRNNFFDANDWFNNNLGKPVSAERQNDFGGTLGGPVWIPKVYDGRKRSFFFFSYEGLRLMQPQPAETLYVPSTALRQSAAAPLIPILDAFPIPTGPPLSNGLAPFVQVDSLPSSIDSSSIRFDQQLSSRLSFFFRFGDTQSSTETRDLSTLASVSQSSYTSTLGVIATLSTSITNDFRMNYTSNRGSSTNALDNFGGAQLVNLLQLQGLPSTAQDGIDLDFPGYQPQVTQVDTNQPQQSWNFVDNFIVARGRQTLKFGFNYRKFESSFQYPSPLVYSLFDSSADVISNNSYFSLVDVDAEASPVYTNTAAYIQDEIRANKRLSLSAGLRWEVNPPPTQSNSPLPYIAVGDLADPASLQLAPAGTKFWKTTFLNFAPRLGLAWQANRAPGRETVIRIGGGVFFDSGQQTSAQPFGNSTGQLASAYYFGVSYPLLPSQTNVSIVNPPVAPYSTTYFFPSRLQLPYTLEWNTSLEQAIGKNQTITLSYVGSNGRRLLWQQIVTPGAAAPNFLYIYDEGSGTTSDYNALQVQFHRTLSRGLQVLASYNWSHSIDYGTQNLDFAQIRGNSDYDLRQNFNAAISYVISSSSANRLVRGLVDKWGIDGRLSARTAFPVILDGNEITEPNGLIQYSGLDLIPGVPVYLHTPGIAGNRRINPAAFALPAAGEGNAPRNFVRGFGANQLDLAIRRTFPLFEKVNLQFRAETFNILNHPNFGYIQPNYGNVQFGEATKMLSQSLGGLSPLYQQGGSRSMQFALRLEF
jgi:hypothetical protein